MEQILLQCNVSFYAFSHAFLSVISIISTFEHAAVNSVESDPAQQTADN